ncbi:MAG: hypothetical protein NT119_10630, partial [Actinobacteria bacterium]|nr:hypothetical protein [Actinomycetota bacterium]
MVTISASDYIDLTRYPIDEVGSARNALIEESNLAIKDDGCVVLKGFVKQERVSELVAECDRVERHGHRNFTRTNPYFLSDREDLPTSHPLRRFYDRSNAFVPADNFGSESILRAIFNWSAFSPFIKEVLGEEKF